MTTERKVQVKYRAGPVAYEAHKSKARVKYLWGPLGTAKTSWLCWRVYFMAKRAAKAGVSLRALLLRDTYRNLADSTLRTWLHWFPDDGVAGRKVSSTPVDYLLKTPDGREHEVLFRHGQTAQDASALLSTEYGFIGFEEIAPAYLPGKDAKVSPGIAEEVFNMAFARLRQQGLDEPELACVSNPPSPSHWGSKRIIDCDPEKLKKLNWAHWFTPISENQKNLRPGYYEELTAAWPRILVRRFVEGERVDIFVGIPRFNLDKLDEMRKRAPEPGFRGFLQHSPQNILHVKLEPNPNGYVRMYAPPKAGSQYVMGADVAEGLEGLDYSSGFVLERGSLAIAAEWHGHIEPDKFATELAKLGKLYGNALIGVESNNHGLVTLVKLRDLAYPRIFYQQNIEIRNRRSERIGWQTNTKTKPMMIDGIANYLQEGGEILSADLLSELMTYGVMDNGETQAQEGCHDDRVIAFAIALQMHKFFGLERIYPSLGTGGGS